MRMTQLKEELGNKKMAKLEPPSKNRLTGVNKRPDLVEKRRRELESWLWKLIGDGEIARSQVLNKFLELSDAARLVQRGLLMSWTGFGSLSSVCPEHHDMYSMMSTRVLTTDSASWPRIMSFTPPLSI